MYNTVYHNDTPLLSRLPSVTVQSTKCTTQGTIITQLYYLDCQVWLYKVQSVQHSVSQWYSTKPSWILLRSLQVKFDPEKKWGKAFWGMNNEYASK